MPNARGAGAGVRTPPPHPLSDPTASPIRPRPGRRTTALGPNARPPPPRTAPRPPSLHQWGCRTSSATTAGCGPRRRERGTRRPLLRPLRRPHRSPLLPRRRLRRRASEQGPPGARCQGQARAPFRCGPPRAKPLEFGDCRRLRRRRCPGRDRARERGRERPGTERAHQVGATVVELRERCTR